MLLPIGAILFLSMAWLVSRSGGDPLPWQGGMASSAQRYLQGLGAPRGAGPLTDLRLHDRDGLQNEEASGSYRAPPPASAVTDHYRAACRRLGLNSPASADTIAYYPRALCDGAVIVTVSSRCTRHGCDVFVKVTG
jgi:hypothetical protein